MRVTCQRGRSIAVNQRLRENLRDFQDAWAGIQAKRKARGTQRSPFTQSTPPLCGSPPHEQRARRSTRDHYRQRGDEDDCRLPRHRDRSDGGPGLSPAGGRAWGHAGCSMRRGAAGTGVRRASRRAIVPEDTGRKRGATTYLEVLLSATAGV